MRGSTALMAVLLLLVSLAAADIRVPSAGIHIPYREKSEEEMRLIFLEWKAKMGRIYSTIGEEERRYATFKDTLRKIDQHNAAGIYSYRLGLNHFADLTQEEFSAFCCGEILPADQDKDTAVWSPTGEEERHSATIKDRLHEIDQHNAVRIRSYRLGLIIPSDHDKDKAAWRLMTYMLFGCSFFIIYFTIC